MYTWIPDSIRLKGGLSAIIPRDSFGADGANVWVELAAMHILGRVLKISRRFPAMVGTLLKDPGAIVFKVSLGIGNRSLLKYVTRRPQTFYQYLRHKMVTERDERLIIVADKIRCKDFVKKRLPDALIPVTLQSAASFHELNRDEFPHNFVLKVNHASGGVLVVSEMTTKQNRTPEIRAGFAVVHVHPDDITDDYLADQTDIWLGQTYGVDKGEWPYASVEPRVFVEEFLQQAAGKPIVDWKFYVIGGKCELILRSEAIGVNPTPHHNFYCPEAGALETKAAGYMQPWRPRLIPPPNFPGSISSMISTAERLARDFDFLRVDLLETISGIYVGELTAFPNAATGRFSDPCIDRRLGEAWSASRTLK